MTKLGLHQTALANACGFDPSIIRKMLWKHKDNNRIDIGTLNTFIRKVKEISIESTILEEGFKPLILIREDLRYIEATHNNQATSTQSSVARVSTSNSSELAFLITPKEGPGLNDRPNPMNIRKIYDGDAYQFCGHFKIKVLTDCEVTKVWMRVSKEGLDAPSTSSGRSSGQLWLEELGRGGTIRLGLRHLNFDKKSNLIATEKLAKGDIKDFYISDKCVGYTDSKDPEANHISYWMTNVEQTIEISYKTDGARYTECHVFYFQDGYFPYGSIRLLRSYREID
ncbi:hypothetical protein [Methylobacterium pseudosasicola]|uniref:Uncharacterized protein n=1 Tax=Methylobacterium pseudosasicola TaxID=582667 RepID=A0A1I4PTD4_9HYPH|nr:hypothetical protein [Methylobacterium pseudosasicola]SFM30826.1 hypothetical protein SAMN05192568_102640 [Methylobacterium pseudosasicola]